MRPAVDLASVGSILPFTVWSGNSSVQVGKLKVLTEVPPAKVTVRVKLIVVPQTKPGPVLTEKGTVFVPVPSIGIFG
jgi:hypothetical protein